MGLEVVDYVANSSLKENIKHTEELEKEHASQAEVSIYVI
jgi:hypothetical protein